MNLQNTAYLIFVIFFAIILSACAIGNEYALHTAVPQLNSHSNGSIALSVLDKRTYILSGEKDPDFIGLQRGGYGNPFNVTTKSDNSFAQDFLDALSKALQRSGFEVVPVYSGHNMSVSKAKNVLLLENTDKMLFINIEEWKSDTYSNIGLNYNILTIVYNKNGQELAKKRLKGKADLGGSFMNPTAYAKRAVPKALKKKIQKILQDPGINKALF